MMILLLGCTGGALFQPATMEGDASAPVIAWDDTLMMSVLVGLGTWEEPQGPSCPWSPAPTTWTSTAASTRATATAPARRRSGTWSSS